MRQLEKPNLELTVNREGRQISDFRGVLFYGISLLISLILIVISVTVFVVVIYLEGRVNQNFFFLFVSILASNLLISGISLWKLLKALHAFSFTGREKSIYELSEKSLDIHSERHAADKNLTHQYFTSAELEIIDFLQKNRNRMLQSTIVSSTGTSKATISRAITSLENKGVVIRLRKGVTNEIILSETYFK